MALNNDATSLYKAFYTHEIRKEVREPIQEKGRKPVVIVDEVSLLRLEVLIASVKNQPFTDAALTAVYLGSGGIYRKTNNLARGAFIAAAVDKASQVIPDHVQIASSEIF